MAGIYQDNNQYIPEEYDSEEVTLSLILVFTLNLYV